MKLNCWEVVKCGCEPGGKKSKELGICPAATERKLHDVNDGVNGGRACWSVEGTLCGGEVQGTFAAKIGNCLKCDFYSRVKSEEASRFVTVKELMEIIYGVN